MRKRILHIAIAVMLVFFVTDARALTGGPDAYGYTWEDSAEPNVTYNWLDITGWPGAVQVTGLADDNSVGPFNIGFDFEYYWTTYNSVKVGSNGWVSFDNVGNIASCFPNVPSAGGAGDNLLCPYMSDLSFISNSTPNPGEMWTWTNNVDSFIIQYVDVPWWDQGTPNWTGSNTFELILTSVDSSITFQYQTTDDANFVPNTCPSSMEIGIENITGNIGLNLYSGATLPPDAYAVKFFYPPNVTFQVPDATPAWSANSDNAGQFFYTQVPVSLQTNVANVGNFEITNQVNVDGEIRNLALQSIWTGAENFSGLLAGMDSTVTFSNPWTITAAGQYYFDVDVSNSQDINPSNNSNSVEISALDNNGGSVNLSYATGNPADDAISWAGGGIDDGCAVKMVPPGYPAVLDSVYMWIEGDGDPQTPMPVGYSVGIYGLDPMGVPDPNNLLQLEVVDPTNIVEGAWNGVRLDTAVTISSGGFAVAWLQGGTGVALGTEILGPMSRRSYEILGGAWSTFRDNTVRELLIQVSTQLPVSVEPGQEILTDIHVFPNPIKDLATVSYTKSTIGDVDFEMMNTMGQVVWNKTHSGIQAGSHLFNIDCTQMPSGVYFVNMSTDGERVTKKVVVQ